MELRLIRCERLERQTALNGKIGALISRVKIC
jgi:hypothetical protein